MKFEKFLKIVDLICISLLVCATFFVVAFKFSADANLLKASILLYIFAFLALVIFSILQLIKNLKVDNKENKQNGVVWLIIKVFLYIIFIGFAIYIFLNLK